MGKSKILVVEDKFIETAQNTLWLLPESNFNFIFATNLDEARDILWANWQEIATGIIDVCIPNVVGGKIDTHGIGFFKEARQFNVPVVLFSDFDAHSKMTIEARKAIEDQAGINVVKIEYYFQATKPIKNDPRSWLIAFWEAKAKINDEHRIQVMAGYGRINRQWDLNLSFLINRFYNCTF